MKQLFQNVRSGLTEVAEVPAPGVPPGAVCVAVAASVVSAGTERSVMEFAQQKLFQKAISRPDLVRQILDKVHRDGLASAWDSVQARLDQPIPLGYAASGVVIAAGEDAGFRTGDHVACAGAGHAVHAEVIVVPKHLLARIPDGVDLESAAFATLGAIALHGVRLAGLQVGETAVVIGLGLIGQLAVQIFKASGCQVAAIDLNVTRAELALTLGCDVAVTSASDLGRAVDAMSDGHGADAVLIAADTSGNEPVELAGRLARDRGTVVAVGAVGLSLPRKPYYEKELEFHVSRSYGPGRYDPDYELKGRDYPYGHVRWTEQRNLSAFVDLLAQRRVRVTPLVTHRFPIERGLEAAALIKGDTGQTFLGVVLQYPAASEPSRRVELRQPNGRAFATASKAEISVAVLGAGLFATTTALPALKKIDGVRLSGVCAATGLHAHAAARRYGARFATTDERDILSDASTDAVLVLTRHRLHARQVVAALNAGKSVFVEKPPCVNAEELQTIDAAWRRTRSPDAGEPVLMVGFNRRWAPMVIELRRTLRKTAEPLFLHYRVNAGYLPPTHWSHDPAEGGRLVGEGCHFIDLLIDLAGERVVEVCAHALPDSDRYRHDNLIVRLLFANGSQGLVTYMANGSNVHSKERLEVSGGGLAAVLEDYRDLRITGGATRTRRRNRFRPDKGHAAQWREFAAAVRGERPEPLAWPAIHHSMRAVFGARDSLLQDGVPIGIDPGP